jgi:hypothetical protein
MRAMGMALTIKFIFCLNPFLIVEKGRKKLPFSWNATVAVHLNSNGCSGGADKSCENGVDSMDNIRFEIIRLTPEQTREQIQLNHFSEDHKLALKDRFS